MSSSPAIQITSGKREDKIKEIVDKYRNGEGSLYLPENPQLEDEFDAVMGQLYAAMSVIDPQMMMQLYGILRLKYRRFFHGVRPVSLPYIPVTATGLCDFIAEKSTPYEVLLVHHAVEVLNDERLKTALVSYESTLSQHMISTLESYKKKRVTLPLCADHTHMAVVISKEQVLLALVLHLKEYFAKYLQLEETLFEGFEEGCIVLFFSILKEDAALLAPKVLPHLAELNKVFNITHLIVFEYFVCNLDKATIETFDNVSILCVFYHTQFYHTQFYCTQFYCTQFYCTQFYCTRFYCTQFYCTQFYRTQFYHTQFYCTQFYRTQFYRTQFYCTQFYRTQFYHTQFYCTQFYRTQFYRTQFYRTQFYRTQFYRTQFYRTQFYRTQFYRMQFYHTQFYRTQFYSTQLYHTYPCGVVTSDMCIRMKYVIYFVLES